MCGCKSYTRTVAKKQPKGTFKRKEIHKNPQVQRYVANKPKTKTMYNYGM